MKSLTKHNFLRKAFTCLAILVLSYYTAHAQFHFGIHGAMGVPANQFREATTANGGGFGLSAFFPFDRKIPIFLGVDFGYMVYGINNNRQRINGTISVGNQVIQTIPLDYRITTTNNLLSGHLVLRVRIPIKLIQPYFDGCVGFKNFYTRTTITDETRNNNTFNNNNTNPFNTNNNTYSNSVTNLSDVALSYGGGGGFMIGSGPIRLDIRCLYLLGEEARFFDRSSAAGWSVNFSQNTNQFDSNINLSSAKRSRTDMFYAQIGMIISF